ncbi:hypothetical protein D9M69_600040 [compost metagenome]
MHNSCIRGNFRTISSGRYSPLSGKLSLYFLKTFNDRIHLLLFFPDLLWPDHPPVKAYPEENNGTCEQSPFQLHPYHIFVYIKGDSAGKQGEIKVHHLMMKKSLPFLNGQKVLHKTAAIGMIIQRAVKRDHPVINSQKRNHGQNGQNYACPGG